MGMTGALGGLGQGISDVAGGRITHMNLEKMDQLRKQAEIEKEARIAEINQVNAAQSEQYKIDAEGRNEQATIRQEARTHDNAIRTRNEKLAFETDPEKVAAATNAELQSKRMQDQYGDTRAPILDQQAKARQDLLDPGVAEGRRLQNEVLKANLEKAKNSSEFSPKAKAGLDWQQNQYKAVLEEYNNAQKDYEDFLKENPGTIEDPGLSSQKRGLIARKNELSQKLDSIETGLNMLLDIHSGKTSESKLEPPISKGDIMGIRGAAKKEQSGALAPKELTPEEQDEQDIQEMVDNGSIPDRIGSIRQWATDTSGDRLPKRPETPDQKYKRQRAEADRRIAKNKRNP